MSQATNEPESHPAIGDCFTSPANYQVASNPIRPQKTNQHDKHKAKENENENENTSQLNSIRGAGGLFETAGWLAP